MSVNYKYHKTTYDGTSSIKDIMGEYNNASLPGGIIDKLTDQFILINGEELEGLTTEDIIYVPILRPFQKKYTDLLTEEEVKYKPLEEAEEGEEEPTVQPVERSQPQIVERHDPFKPGVTTEPEVSPEEREEKKEKAREAIRNALQFKERKPVKDIRETKPYPKTEVEVPEVDTKNTSGIKYRTFPYKFARPNETVQAVIRLYNDMNMSKPVLEKLAFEFARINPHAQPPRLGQTVKVPVLMPFVYRHMNENKV